MYALEAKLEPSDFFSRQHNNIFECMVDNRNEDGTDYFERVWKDLKTKKLDVKDEYLDHLMEEGGVFHNAGLLWHCRSLKLLSYERKEIALVGEVYADLQQGFDVEDKMLDLDAVRIERADYEKGEPEAFGNGIDLYWKNLMTIAQSEESEDQNITLSAIPSINTFTQGFRFGEISILAGSPGSGKSALALTFILEAIEKTNHKTALLSLEMNLDEINARLINQLTGVPLRYLLNPRLLQEKQLIEAGENPQKLWDDLWLAQSQMQGLAKNEVFQAVSLESFNPDNVILAIERAIGAGAKFIVLDHLHRLQFSTRTSFSESMTAFCVRMTELAKANKVHILCLSQVNRESPKEGRKARMHDLKGSGGIEENASLILMLHRDIENSPTEAELHIAKARSGQAGRSIRLNFIGSRMTFTEMAEEYNYHEEPMNPNQGVDFYDA